MSLGSRRNLPADLFILMVIAAMQNMVPIQGNFRITVLLPGTTVLKHTKASVCYQTFSPLAYREL